MTAQILARNLRLPTLFLLAGVALFAALSLYANWGAFMQWCLSVQITLHRYLVMYLLQLNNHQYAASLWLLTGAFIYGILHAIDPGHGKFIVTTWLSTHQESLTATRLVPFSAA